jgi:hypothetical protein
MNYFYLIFFGFLFIGCHSPPRNYQITQIRSEPTTIVKIIDYVTALSIQELANKSDLVILGKAMTQGEVLNTARDPRDITKPDSHYFGIGQIYNFTVEKYSSYHTLLGKKD